MRTAASAAEPEAAHVDLDALRPADFRALSGERFAVRTWQGSAAGAGSAEGHAGLELELVAVEDLRPHSRRAEPFSLTFRGPRRQLLPQGIHTLESPRMGALQLFLVPIRGDAESVDYEAIFN
jgi:hypothetical protein